MTRIHILGGTGYAGAHIAREAASRGHEVVSVSRHLPPEPILGVTYRTGDVTDTGFLTTALDGAEVVIVALSPRGVLGVPGALRSFVQSVAEVAAAGGVRLGVIGGAGSLRLSPDGPRLVDTDAVAELPDAMRIEVQEMTGVLEVLQADADDRLDWFLLSPPQNFGAHAPGEATGAYRVGGDVLLQDDEGGSAISGQDFALAIVDEIDEPAHHRRRFTVAY